MKKVYGVPGVAHTQLVLTSPSGKTKYKITFTGGITHSREKVPAKCITDSPIIQDVIESSPLFNKKIFLLNSFDTPVKTAEKPASPVIPPKKQTTPIKGRTGRNGIKEKTKDAPIPSEEIQPIEEETKTDVPQIYEDVTTLGDAISILTGSVSGDRLTSVEGVLQAAKELGISFPNLSKE